MTIQYCIEILVGLYNKGKGRQWTKVNLKQATAARLGATAIEYAEASEAFIQYPGPTDMTTVEREWHEARHVYQVCREKLITTATQVEEES
jgi:hypothetical protein